MIKTDTIAAIATGMGNSGIGIIRISGPESLNIASKMYRSKNGKKKDFTKAATHRAYYGSVAGINKCGIQTETILDDAIFLIFRNPASYTGEDVVEIQCHGGSFVLQRILETVISNGIRLAEPGEFSKRAFLNGKMDLTQAEAVMDLIESGNDYALESAAQRLNGALKGKIRTLRSEILYQTAYIESALDDPEHISLDGYDEKLQIIVDKLIDSVENLLKNADNGRIIQEGIHTVIIGRPNVGKSTLWNAILGESRAIVTSIPGTTRDVLEEKARFGDLELVLKDTAGIRDSNDPVEQIGVIRSRKMMEEADLILMCFDVSKDPVDDDVKLINEGLGREIIYILNKADLAETDHILLWKEWISRNAETDPTRIAVISAERETGFPELEEMIRDMFLKNELHYNNEVIITSLRHKDLLNQTLESLIQVKNSILNSLPEDFYTIDLMDAYDALGRITGDTAGEDLINEIFHKFCTGK